MNWKTERQTWIDYPPSKPRWRRLRYPLARYSLAIVSVLWALLMALGLWLIFWR